MIEWVDRWKWVDICDLFPGDWALLYHSDGGGVEGLVVANVTEDPLDSPIPMTEILMIHNDGRLVKLRSPRMSKSARLRVVK